MGQNFAKPICCVGKEDPSDPMSARPLHDPAPIEQELNGLRQGLHALHEVVGDLQDEMERLRIENGMLQETNSGLTDENLRLLRQIDTEKDERTWNSFDIVERHYREVAHHRARITSLESPRTAQEGQEAPGDHCTEDDFLSLPNTARDSCRRQDSGATEAEASAIQGDNISDPADEAAGLPIAASESSERPREKEVDFKKTSRKPFVDQESSSTHPPCDEDW